MGGVGGSTFSHTTNLYSGPVRMETESSAATLEGYARSLQFMRSVHGVPCTRFSTITDSAGNTTRIPCKMCALPSSR